MYKAGCGRFSPDVRQLCKAVRAEMQVNYLVTDQQGWKSFVLQLQRLWHPDKNAEYAKKANEVFKFVQKEKKKLEGNIHLKYSC